MWIWIVLAAVVAFAAWVRLAPIDAAEANTPIAATGEERGMGHAVRIVPDTGDTMARLDRAILAEPATTRIAGSVEAGRATYVSRSRWWGFPDLTTIERREGSVALYGRLRFGRGDFGVNAARLERVIRAAQA